MEHDLKYRKLRTWNLIMGGLHLIQAAVIFALSRDFTMPVTSAFLNFDQATQSLKPVTDTVFNLPFGGGVALFLLISSIAHFTIASPKVFPWYARNLSRGINYARWFEYSLSASVMVVLIALLSGLSDIAALLSVFTLTAVMNLCGLLMEVRNQTTAKTDWAPFWVGSLAGIIPWLAIAFYFFGSIATADGAVPTFVYFILPILFVFFNLFAINMWLQYKKVGRWADYLYGERVYILLSLLAKSALAWQVFAGTLRP
ncbi:MAG: heliorhodopsin HeR [Dehalogenimonas sp.]|uniref:Heliorhodopsin HeR n=1 Tax=Candidatus Dehalogenimonas loeffleri TaxID=3127115 RepID=A0ABZ2J392_9CHLR|nr:heliorhodopsin HeR [Dehalogenimonas sp.]